MTIQTIREFAPADRYLYDFRVCTYALGWAQMDTRQDASYYGNWVNPTSRELFSYCEGDTTLVRCETDAEFASMVREWATWSIAREYWLGIDPGFGDAMRARFTDLGLADLLH